jgi:hypothetical protein
MIEDKEWTDLFDNFSKANFFEGTPWRLTAELREARSARVQKSRRAASLANYNGGVQARLKNKPIWANPHMGDAGKLWANGWRSASTEHKDTT